MGDGFAVEYSNGARNLWDEPLQFLEPESEHSPWSHLTDGEAAEDTHPVEGDTTPTPIPLKPSTKQPGRELVPMWMTAALLVGIVLLCLMGIGVVVKVMAK